MFCAGVGVSVTKGNQTIFDLSPTMQTVLILQHSKTTTQQHQSNTKATPKQHQDRATERATTDRARAISTDTDVT